MATEALPVHIETDGPLSGVVTVTLQQPGKPVVVLDRALIEALDRAIDEIPADARAVVLASASERVFVAGADLKSISELDDDGLMAYLAFGSRVFGRLSSLPCTTVAAINGAALGGGLELAMHCDGLVGCPGVKPYPVGLPEAGLSICPGWGGTNLLPARIDPAIAILATAEGKPMLDDEARSRGMFDAWAPSRETLLETSARWALDNPRPEGASAGGAPSKWIGTDDARVKVREAMDGLGDTLAKTDPGRAVAGAVRAGLETGWMAALGVEQRELTRLRNEPAGKSAIAAFFERSAKK